MASEADKGVEIEEPGKNDVLSGRGNSVNFHPGNEYFRSLVKQYRVEYVACPKPLKGHFSKLIVDNILSLDPPGRFLKQDPKTKLWSEIGYKKSLDKTRQALREGAPELMKEMNLGPDGRPIDGKPIDKKAVKAAAAPTLPDHVASITPEPMSSSPLNAPLSVEVPKKKPATPSIPSILTKPEGAKHISVKDMENILETLQKKNSALAAAATSYRDNLETNSISSDIFDDDAESMDHEKLPNVPSLLSARKIADQTPNNRPSITLGSSATQPQQKGVSWSVSMDKISTTEGSASLEDLLQNVRNQMSTSDFEFNGNYQSLEQIIDPEKPDSIPLEQRSELLLAIHQFLQCTTDENKTTGSNTTTTSLDLDSQQEFDLSQYTHRIPGRAAGGDPNMSEMSMSLNSLGTFDPSNLYPYKKDDEKQKNNRSRSRLDDYNNSLFDSMQMSLASLQMDNAD